MVAGENIARHQKEHALGERMAHGVQHAAEERAAAHAEGQGEYAHVFHAGIGQKALVVALSHVVVVGHDMSGEKLSSITLDYKSTLVQILQEYYDRGNKEAYYLDVTMAGNMMDDVRDACLDYAQSRGETLSLIHSEDSYQRLYSDMKEYFTTPSHHKGLFICPRDSLACAVINAAEEKGIKIPDEIQVISVVGTKYSYIVRPQVSSLEIDWFEVGSIAVRMLTKLLKDDLDQKVYRFKSQFAIRGSTKK